MRICLVGLGKTGKEIAKVLVKQEGMELVSVVCRPGSDKIGKDLGQVIGIRDTGIIIESSEHLEHIIFRTKPDIAIDFSNPHATVRNAVVFSRMKVNMVIGTTGFSPVSLKRLYILTKKHHNGIVYAPNITLGVNVLMLLASLASGILSNYDFEIMEIHHSKKKDAPSGTAIKIAKEMEKALESSPAAVKRDIPIHAVRAGGVIGKHEVMIIGEEDKIVISHESFSRKVFALGALQAVNFIFGKVGYFEMSDVLNLNKVLSNCLEKDKSTRNKKQLRYETGEGQPMGLWA